MRRFGIWMQAHFPNSCRTIFPTGRDVRFILSLSLLIIAFFYAGSIGYAADVTLAWDDPNAPGSANGFLVYYGTQSGVYDWIVDAGKATSYEIPNLREGKSYYFSVRAYSDTGVKSGYSSELFFKLPSSDGDGSGEKIIIDNGDVGTSATGIWLSSFGSSYYGSMSEYSIQAGATYSFETAATGTHEVSMWWTSRSTRSTEVPVQIWDGDTLLDTVYVNQRVNAGQWNILGTYDFSGLATVVVVSNSSSTNACADAVMLVNQGISRIPQVIVDNGDIGTSATGLWIVSAGSPYYGNMSEYSAQAGATYSFETAVTGTYEVSMWWTSRSTRSTDVPIEIWDGDTLLDTVYVNQRVNGGQWNVLGTYNFTGLATVVVVSNGNSTNVCADAVKFEL